MFNKILKLKEKCVERNLAAIMKILELLTRFLASRQRHGSQTMTNLMA